jgi:hypothetical protein
LAPDETILPSPELKAEETLGDDGEEDQAARWRMIREACICERPMRAPISA